MIIYKKQENGRATDFQFSRKCPDGWLSIEGDKIPEDISMYHDKKYIDFESLKTQKQKCIRLLDESEIHVSNDPPYPNDVSNWITIRNQWRQILKSDEIQEIPPKPFG